MAGRPPMAAAPRAAEAAGGGGWWDGEVGRTARRLRRADPRAPGGVLPDLEDLQAAAEAAAAAQQRSRAAGPPADDGGRPHSLPADLSRLALSRVPWHRAVAWRLLRLLSSGAGMAPLRSLDADPLVRGFWGRACDGAGGASEQFEALALCRAWLLGRGPSPELPAVVAAGLVSTAGDSGSRAYWQVLQLLRLLSERAPAQLAGLRGIEPLVRAACESPSLERPSPLHSHTSPLANSCARAVGAALADPLAFEKAEGSGWSALAPALAPLLDAATAEGITSTSADAEERLDASRLGLGRVTRSWGGLFCVLSSADGTQPSALGCLVRAYRTTERQDVRWCLLRVFSDLLGVPPPQALYGSRQGSGEMQVKGEGFASSPDSSGMAHLGVVPAGPCGALFNALALQGFIEVGGANALLLAVERGHSSEAAAELLANVVYLAGVLFPARWVVSLHELAPSFAGRDASRLIQDAVKRVMQRDFDSESLFNLEAAVAGSSAASQGKGEGESLGGEDGNMRAMAQLQLGADATYNDGDQYRRSIDDASPSAKDFVLEKKIVLSRSELDYMIAATGVAAKRSNDWRSWDWAAILQWVEGPLSARNGWQVSLSSKILKRLSAFFCKRLSTVPRNHPSADLMVASGHGLVQSLLVTPEGQSYLCGTGSGNAKCRLLKFGIRALHLEAARESSFTKRIFHPLVLEKTLGGELLGMLTSAMNTPAGEAILKRHGFLDTIESIFQLEQRSDLHGIIIHSIDFRHPRAPRRFLETVGNISNRNSRLMCLSVAKKIIEALPWLQLEPEEDAPLSQIINPMHEGDPKAGGAAAVVAAAAAESEATRPELFDLSHMEDRRTVAVWVAALLMDRALKSAGEERAVAVSLLVLLHGKGYGYCLVAAKPDASAFGREPDLQEVMLLVLASKGGQKYLQGSDWFGHELVRWSPGGPKAEEFLCQMDNFFAAELGLAPRFDEPSWENSSESRSSAVGWNGSQNGCHLLHSLRPSLPLHFCGVLSSSPVGAATVGGDYLEAILGSLREVSAPSRERVAAAVVLGQVAGAGKHGFALAQNSGGLKDLVAFARSARHSNLRAACMLALSLSARHPPARAFLRQAGWETRMVRQSPTCCYALCLPENCPSFSFAVRGCRAPKEGGASLQETALPAADDPASAALASVAAMSNPVPSNQEAAKSELRGLRRKHASLFQQESFFLSAVTMLEKYRYSLSARRFVWDLFDGGLENLVSADKGASGDANVATPDQ